MECITGGKYELRDTQLTIWLPHESHVSMYAVQAGQLESFLRQRLEREDIRVALTARPEAFPEIRAIHTSEERWRYLCERNPLALELLRRAKGQVLPKDIEIPLSDED